MLDLYLPALEAQEVLDDKGDRLTPEGILKLTEIATGDRDRAEEAYSAAVLWQERG